MEKGLIKMVFYNTEDLIDDIFTKALGKDQFEKNRMMLGLMRQH